VFSVLRILALFAFVMAGSAAAAEETLSIELNSIGVRSESCEVYLRVRNQTPNGYSVFKVDLAFFDRAGVINDRSLVELGPLRANKTSMHVFQMPDMDCDNVGEVLLNDVTQCTPAGEGAVAPADCLDVVSLSSKSDIAFTR
jgi:hypothetical protein